MSGGIVQLVATGVQDVHLSGNPEVSFFRSNYKRHTHFASSVERMLIQGQPTPAGISTIRIERKGDLLSYTYFTAKDSTGLTRTDLDWSQIIDRVELLIGGQVIDLQDPFFTYNTLLITESSPNLLKSVADETLLIERGAVTFQPREAEAA